MKKILIVGPSWVGDAVMAEPLYARLHERHPGVEIHVLAPSWTLPVLDRMKSVQQSHLNPFGHGQLRLGARWRLAKSLRQHAFDQVIVLPNSLKSALIPAFMRTPLRTGFLGELRYGLLNDARDLDEHSMPRMIDRFMGLAEDKSAMLNFKTDRVPALHVHPEQVTQVLEKLNLTLEKPILALCPGAEFGSAKRWPSVHFAKLAQHYASEGWSVWIFGSNKDLELAQEIERLAHTDAVLNLCGVTPLDEAIDLMSLAKLAVCNDSGLMHIAAALDIPLIALYGSSSPDFTPPLTHKAEILSLLLECSPCFERVCPLGHLKCLNDLKPERVIVAANELLA